MVMGWSQRGGDENATELVPQYIVCMIDGMGYIFRWVRWNLEHATRHGVIVGECERIVQGGRYRETGDGKCRAVGRGSDGRWLQVVFSLTEDDEVFVIHSRPLTEAEKHRERRNER